MDFAFDYAESTRGISGDGGPLILSFFGGEPSLARDVVEPLVDYAREQSSRRGRKLRFSLPTNGTLLDDDWLDFLVANEFRIQVSLDGARQAQDATRCFADGRSSWPDVSRNLARLSTTPLEVIVVSIVDPRNVRFLAEGVPVLRQLGVRHLYYVPNLSATWSEADWDVLDQGLAALASQWADCLRTDQDIRLDPFHAKVQSHIRQGGAPAARCSFGKRELAISPRGRLYPCDRIVKADDDDTLCLGDLERGLDRGETSRPSLAAASRCNPSAPRVPCEADAPVSAGATTTSRPRRCLSCFSSALSLGTRRDRGLGPGGQHTLRRVLSRFSQAFLRRPLGTPGPSQTTAVTATIGAQRKELATRRAGH